MRDLYLENLIFDPSFSFNEKVLRVFSYQFEHCEPYRIFCDILGKSPQNIVEIEDIPFYPILGFKQTQLLSNQFDVKQSSFFQSSGTSKQEKSIHFVPVLDLYKKGSWQHFSSIFPDFGIFAYVPSYSENPHSSLISMLDYFVTKQNENNILSQFLPVSNNGLFDVPKDKPIILFGAAFGLLNATDSKQCILHKDSILIETGGMKTHRKEITRADLFEQLSLRFGLPQEQIYSEYGMAELLSQAYKKGPKSGFSTPNWMQISIRTPENPLLEQEIGKEGQIAVIDLANLYSCSFILTEDRGIKNADGGFDVLGRLVDAELRGCNFLFDRD